MKYLDRIADRMLRLRLEAFGAVQIVGPKMVRKNHYGHAAVKERNQDARSR